jgi:NADPH:quinone reductase-like Zn-dependent oxidoreductase/ubiquinone/menaquinone biosynthesis C-methylase UbiE
VLDNAGQSLLLSVHGLEMMTVAKSNSESLPREDARQLCLSVICKPDLSLADPQAVLAYCQIPFLSTSEPVEFFHDLSLLLPMFISRALEHVNTEPGNWKPHISNYISWMQLKSKAFETTDFKSTTYEDLCRRVKSYNKQGTLYVEVGRKLARILNGEIDMLDLLFNHDLAKDFYQDMNQSINSFSTFGKYLDALAHVDPDMKILEVGAGTGGSTTLLMQTLVSTENEVRFSSYDFTDVSASFFEKAKDALGDQKRIAFTVLDVERDPSLQGFENGTYDLIIAANVIHATKNLNCTLKNIRKLLKPGGKLMLFEITNPDIIRSGFIFGLLPGWWASEDNRKWSPCVTPQRWDQLLKQERFSGTDHVFRDFEDDSCHELSIMVSTAVAEEKKSTLQGRTVIISEGPDITNIGTRIQQCIEEVSGSACGIWTLAEAAEAGSLANICCIFLELEHSSFKDVDQQTFYSLRKALTSTRNVLWITTVGSPDRGLVDGFSRVLRTENPQLKFVTLGFENKLDRAYDTSRNFKTILEVLDRMRNASSVKDIEPTYTEIDGMLQVPRIVEASILNRTISSKTMAKHSALTPFGTSVPLELSIRSPGLLDTLEFSEDATFHHPLGEREVEIEVKAIGLNFMDCLVALGRVNDRTFGTECAGVISRVGPKSRFLVGDRVCAATLHTYKTFARADSDTVQNIPASMSYAEGAAMPTTFGTAYHSLVNIARLQVGESILIHSGAGGTGQAAIQIAQLYRADIFVTVGSDEKKLLVMDQYGIPEDHIFYSRDVSFAQSLARMTGDEGVDIVLNSLAGDSLIASWQCVKPFGRFLELGKKDIYSNHKLPMLQFAKNISFCAIDFAAIISQRPRLVQDVLKNVFDLRFRGSVRPAHPLHVFKISEVEQAFRSMQSGKNTGKTVIEVGNELVQVSRPPKARP